MRTLIVGLISLFCSITVAWGQVISFDTDATGKAPAGFTTDRTGKGRHGTWLVVADTTAPSRPNVLAQTDMDRTDYRFPVCVYDAITVKDVDLSVKFKPLKGSIDQGAGLVWRYRDKDNYYIVRANALEGNVVLYKVEKGKRTDLPLVGKGKTYGMKIRIPSGKWGTLRVICRGDHFDVVYNDAKLYEVEDKTFPEAGKVGLWTKADSYIEFDDFTVAVPGK